eukprot:jgi/Mesvir1/2345/Mv03655-RA.1
MGSKGHKKTPTSKTLNALKSAAADDSAIICFDGALKGTNRRDAIRLYQILFPGISLKEVRAIRPHDLCYKLNVAVVDRLSHDACVQTLASDGGVTRDQLASVAAVLFGRTRDEFAKETKSELCSIVSKRLNAGQRFSFLRRLIPARVMTMIRQLAKTVFAAVGDISVLVSTIPFIDQLMDTVPKPVRLMIHALAGARSAGTSNTKMKGYVYLNMIPALINIAGYPVPPWITLALPLLHPERSIDDTLKMMAASGGVLGVREARRGLRRSKYARDAGVDAEVEKFRKAEIARESQKILEDPKEQTGLRTKRRDIREDEENKRKKMSLLSKLLAGSPNGTVYERLSDEMIKMAEQRGGVKNRTKSLKKELMKPIDRRVMEDSFDELGYAEEIGNLSGDIIARVPVLGDVLGLVKGIKAVRQWLPGYSA